MVLPPGTGRAVLLLLLEAGGEGNRLPTRMSLFVTYYSFG